MLSSKSLLLKKKGPGRHLGDTHAAFQVAVGVEVTPRWCNL